MPVPYIGYLTWDELLCICKLQFSMLKLGIVFSWTPPPLLSPNRFHFCLSLSPWRLSPRIAPLQSFAGWVSFELSLLVGLASDLRIKEEGGARVSSALASLATALPLLHPSPSGGAVVHGSTLPSAPGTQFSLPASSALWLPAVAISWAPQHP